MKNTIGHIPRYITHNLSKRENTCVRWGPTTLPDGAEMHGGELSARLLENYRAEKEKSAEFFAAYRAPDGAVHLTPKWTRDFCGGGFLEPAPGAELKNPHSAVWNIRTDKDVMENHDDIMKPVLRAFIRQVYDEIGDWPLSAPGGAVAVALQRAISISSFSGSFATRHICQPKTEPWARQRRL